MEYLGRRGLAGLPVWFGGLLLAVQLALPAAAQEVGDGGAPMADKAVLSLPSGNPVINNADNKAGSQSQMDASTPEGVERRVTETKSRLPFRDFVAQSIGQELPLYGYSLFRAAPSTFAPVANVPVTPDYLIGPGDEIVIKGWGTVDIDFTVVVNRDGTVTLPKVGTISLAGVRYQDLQGYLRSAIGKVFRNFELNVTLGRLRSIQVFVVGQANSPGVYTVSALSTLVNTLFASGGPSATGSMRHIQVKRNGKVVTELDLYDLLLKGDKTKDVSLLAGDVIYIPPVGQLAAVYGGVNNPAIYELRDETTSLDDLLLMAGGLSTTASGQKVQLERIEARTVRRVEEFPLDETGRARRVRDGDLVQVLSIGARFDNAVTLLGNVASPGRYPWKEGMRVNDLIPDADSLIVSEYWVRQNKMAREPIFDPKGGNRLPVNVGRVVAPINWDYAVIKRLDRNALSVSLIPFNLSKAMSGDAAHNLLLQPGDSVTIFSSDDVRVPKAKREVFVTLEGELSGAGVYQVQSGETLRQLVARVGGLTPNAYLFGAVFTRESVREMQQKKLREMLDRMEEEATLTHVQKEQEAKNNTDVESSKAQWEAQTKLFQRLRQVEATGRMVLEIPAGASQVRDLPDLVLEDGDRLIVPSLPSIVSVMGMVYNENAFIYRSGRSVQDYLAQAGGVTRAADESRIYVLRADGSVINARNSGSLLSSFSGEDLMPGDAIIVPQLLDRIVLTKELKDWTQIFYQFSLGIASLKTIGVLK